jgi:LmbE family N-acetylglucosaminyl deacetylase
LNKKVLIIAPHLDDGKLGCGGTITKLLDQGMFIYYVAFSIGNIVDELNVNTNILLTECKDACKTLGITDDKLILKLFPFRKLNEHRQEILEILIHLKHKINPDIVFMPSSQSIHQDHKAVYLEGIRAFKHKTCYGYDLPWDTDNFKTSCFFTLDKRQLNLKIASLKMYASLKDKTYMEENFLKGLARVRGTQINVEFAEAFEAIRTVF